MTTVPRTRSGVRLPALGSALPSLQACKPTQSATDPRTETRLVRVLTVAPAAGSERGFTGVVTARVQSDLGFRGTGKVIEQLVRFHVQPTVAGPQRSGKAHRARVAADAGARLPALSAGYPFTAD